jgi:GDP-4-dehydro-6-deoxy-D-mannose reductase
MRVLITGAGGFVGRWLSSELRAAGHETIEVDHSLDVRRADDVAIAIHRARPDAIAHLAAVSFAPDAASDPQLAFEVAVRGTVSVLEGMRAQGEPPALLISGSSEVYGAPRHDQLPLRETAPLNPETPYALSKVAQEGVALGYAARFGLRVVLTRSFNHTGPGQRPEFVVPALARRVRALANGDTAEIPVGNIDVRRDLSDVRDVVRAYRLLLEQTAAGQHPGEAKVVNVSSGRSVAIRWIVEELCRLAGVEPRVRVDPKLVRATDPPDIRGDSSVLHSMTGWQPEWTLEATLRSVWQEVAAPQPTSAA